MTTAMTTALTITLCDPDVLARRVAALKRLLATGPLTFTTLYALTAINERQLRTLLSGPNFFSPAPGVYALAGGGR